jgi:hypothetical protein
MPVGFPDKNVPTIYRKYGSVKIKKGQFVRFIAWQSQCLFA